MTEFIAAGAEECITIVFSITSSLTIKLEIDTISKGIKINFKIDISGINFLYLDISLKLIFIPIGSKAHHATI
jgi:hypothetical protein